jgi:hypothetical protein
MEATAAATRQAIEARLNQRARDEKTDANRLRRRLVFERLLVRLDAAEPGAWVVKGGMALEWRLGTRARATRDLDLVLRGETLPGVEIRDRLVEILTRDPQEDHFSFEIGPAQELAVGLRFSVLARLAGREFASVRIDVASGGEELLATELLRLPSTVPAYPQLAPPRVEVAAPAQQFAEKLHALTRDYGEHPNTRLRDLVDLLILLEEDLVPTRGLLPVVRHVFDSRAMQVVPQEIPDPPPGWAADYAHLASQAGLRARTLKAALTRLRQFWRAAQPEQESPNR